MNQEIRKRIREVDLECIDNVAIKTETLVEILNYIETLEMDLGEISRKLLKRDNQYAVLLGEALSAKPLDRFETYA